MKPKHKLMIVAAAAFVAGDYYACPRANKEIGQLEAAHKADLEEVGLRWFTAGAQFALEDKQIVNIAAARLNAAPRDDF